MKYPEFETLPEGVWPIRDYGSLGVTLCECCHAAAHRIPTIMGLTFCRICRSTDLNRPVKMLAIVPKTATQASLF